MRETFERYAEIVRTHKLFYNAHFVALADRIKLDILLGELDAEDEEIILSHAIERCPGAYKLMHKLESDYVETKIGKYVYSSTKGLWLEVV